MRASADCDEVVVEEAKAQGLSSLNLSGRGLATVPPGCGSLSALRSLTLSKNGLGILPASLGSLPALTALDASYNAICEWEDDGAWLGDLTSLTNLNLMANRLLSFPAEPLGKLNRLISLGLKRRDTSASVAASYRSASRGEAAAPLLSAHAPLSRSPAARERPPRRTTTRTTRTLNEAPEPRARACPLAAVTVSGSCRRRWAS